MRFPSAMTSRLVFACAFFAGLALILPLRLVASWLGLGDAGLSARAIRGSVWAGRLIEARFAGVALGDLNARLVVSPLIAGRARVVFADANGGESLHGALNVTRETFGVDGVTGRLTLGEAMTSLPIAALELDDVSARFRGGACEWAEGRVHAVIEGAVAGVSLPGGLAGNARCDGRAMLLPLVSQRGGEAIALRLFGGRRYRLDFIIRSADAAMAERLLAAGFAPRGAGYVITIEGLL